MSFKSFSAAYGAEPKAAADKTATAQADGTKITDTEVPAATAGLSVASSS